MSRIAKPNFRSSILLCFSFIFHLHGGEAKTYGIGEISKMFNLPISTLRYYDKKGLFPNINRNHLESVNSMCIYDRNTTCDICFKKERNGNKRH